MIKAVMIICLETTGACWAFPQAEEHKTREACVLAWEKQDVRAQAQHLANILAFRTGKTRYKWKTTCMSPAEYQAASQPGQET